MSEIKPSQFWIYKGTSNHCSQLEYDYETDTYEKNTPDGFYDYVCTKDTVQGGIHVLEAEPVLKLLREMGDSLKQAIEFIDDMNSKKKYLIGSVSTKEFKKATKSYNTFLASIDKQAKRRSEI